MWTLERITSAVKNNLEAGLKTTTNYPFSMEQLQDTVMGMRNFLLSERMRQGYRGDVWDAEQEINCIPLDCEELALCCEDTGDVKVLHYVIPKYITKSYLGLVNNQDPFKVEKGNAKYNRYRSRYLRERTYVQERLYNGNVHGFIFNPPTESLSFISFKGILENPFDANKYSCCQFNPREDRFPVLPGMEQEIIARLTSDWSSWYYRFQGTRPNTQTPQI